MVIGCPKFSVKHCSSNSTLFSYPLQQSLIGEMVPSSCITKETWQQCHKTWMIWMQNTSEWNQQCKNVVKFESAHESATLGPVFSSKPLVTRSPREPPPYRRINHSKFLCCLHTALHQLFQVVRTAFVCSVLPLRVVIGKSCLCMLPAIAIDLRPDKKIRKTSPRYVKIWEVTTLQFRTLRTRRCGVFSANPLWSSSKHPAVKHGNNKQTVVDTEKVTKQVYRPLDLRTFPGSFSFFAESLCLPSHLLPSWPSLLLLLLQVFSWYCCRCRPLFLESLLLLVSFSSALDSTQEWSPIAHHSQHCHSFLILSFHPYHHSLYHFLFFHHQLSSRHRRSSLFHLPPHHPHLVDSLQMPSPGHTFQQNCKPAIEWNKVRNCRKLRCLFLAFAFGGSCWFVFFRLFGAWKKRSDELQAKNIESTCMMTWHELTTRKNCITVVRWCNVSQPPDSFLDGRFFGIAALSLSDSGLSGVPFTSSSRSDSEAQRSSFSFFFILLILCRFFILLILFLFVILLILCLFVILGCLFGILFGLLCLFLFALLFILFLFRAFGFGGLFRLPSTASMCIRRGIRCPKVLWKSCKERFWK